LQIQSAQTKRRIAVIDNGDAHAAGATRAFFCTGLPLAAVLVIGTAVLSLPGPAAAKPEFAAKTGLPCANCHVNPAGSGPLKPFGERFKANGYSVPKK
jgi:hypothetical protein